MIETRQLHPTLAREVVGLSLWETLDDATVAELRDLYAQYGVLVFRRQALSEAELAAFCALFGPLERTVRSDWASPTTPGITVLSNLKDGLGRPIGGLGDGELQWHSDQSYMMKPATGAALYALQLPSAGGETFWVDLRAAYARMPRQLRAQIAGKRGIFDYAKRLAGYGRETDRQIPDETRRLTPAVTHALIRAHPETGARSLYLDSTTTSPLLSAEDGILERRPGRLDRDDRLNQFRPSVGDGPCYGSASRSSRHTTSRTPKTSRSRAAVTSTACCWSSMVRIPGEVARESGVISPAIPI
jgi:taurine dioxygenase